jgi:uncharacterized protein YutE (UPF0331/DUF86 family)
LTIKYLDIRNKLRKLGHSYDLLVTYREDIRDKESDGGFFEKDDLLRGALENELRVCAQVCIDISYAIASLENLLKANVDENPIVILGRANILPEDFVRRFKGVVNFRNIIVHEYDEINYRMVSENLGKLNDFKEFATYVVKYLEKGIKERGD